MKISTLFKVKDPAIRALHLTWIAFFITFYVWFNMAPLASSILASNEWLTRDDIKLFAIANVALTIPARILVGLALDKYGPRRVFSILMVVMAVPTIFFALGTSAMQLFVSRLFMSAVGAGFVVGIHMTALWFKPRDIGFAEGFYAGWGNFGSAAAALTIPTIALHFFGGDDGWRYAIAMSGVIMAAYGVFYWFAITDGPTADTHKKAKGMALEVSTYKDLVMLVIFTVPLFGILSILVYRVQSMGYIDGFTAVICYFAVFTMVVYQVWQALRTNLPILKNGVPKDDRYPFSSVAALNTTYFANFGAELAVVSMLPFFFQETWGLNPVTAGLIAASFAFINLVARPMGGLVSDRMTDARIRVTSSWADIIMVLIWLQLLVGLLTITQTLQHMDGSEMVRFMTWSQSIVSWNLNAWAMVVDVHWLYKLHIFLGLIITALFPFTRLVHMVSGFAAPFRYLLRPGYQLVRSRRQKALPKRAASKATPAE